MKHTVKEIVGPNEPVIVSLIEYLSTRGVKTLLVVEHSSAQTYARVKILRLRYLSDIL